MSRSNPYRILCAHCHISLYWYTGEFEGEFQMRDFYPINQDIPSPQPGRPLICPQCGQRWHLLRSNGSICVFTDKGWKPRAPDGDAPVTMEKGLRTLMPELPPDMLDSRGNFNERH